MQFGIFSVSDITRDPVSGQTPSEAERIDAIVRIAQKTEEVGLDVFAIGEHHNPPFFSSSPTTLLAFIAATTKRLIVTTATTLITTNDPVRIAEEYAMLQHLAKGRVDLMLGRGNTAPVYPWFGQDIRQGLPLALENYNLLHRLWREDVVDWQGKFRTPLQGFTSIPPTAGRRTAVRMARLDPYPRDRRAGRLLRRRVLRQQHLLAEGALHPAHRVLPPAVRPLRSRYREAGDRRARWPGVPREELAGRQARVPPLLQRGTGLRPRPVPGGLHGDDAAVGG
jgi:alkanesulfonate monooxygenase SsuD/methylene tetrahydromethanopterin reductase-like flavin-dependent oxidoreductase (luciferase family)